MPLPAQLEKEIKEGTGTFVTTTPDGLKINLTSYGLMDADIETLARFCGGKTVAELNLANGNLGNGSTTLLVAHFPSLKTLILRENDIGDDAVKFCEHPSLTHLDLGKNRLSSVAIATLEKTYLDGNRLLLTPGNPGSPPVSTHFTGFRVFSKKQTPSPLSDDMFDLTPPAEAVVASPAIVNRSYSPSYQPAFFPSAAAPTAPLEEKLQYPSHIEKTNPWLKAFIASLSDTDKDGIIQLLFAELPPVKKDNLIRQLNTSNTKPEQRTAPTTGIIT
jgi:hypothetical protein